MAEEAVMLRARVSTRDALREIAAVEGTSLIEALDRIVAAAREERLLLAVEASLDNHVHAIVSETAELDTAIGGEGLEAEDFSDW